MSTTYDHLSSTLSVVKYLQINNIDPILYGSRGVSLYLDNFKAFNDTDLLVQPVWLRDKWDELRALMKADGYVLIDEHEHEFRNSDGDIVAFAEETVLIRDKVLGTLDEIVDIRVGGLTIRTLSPSSFIQAYLFSEKDGYRKDSRGKKDRAIIELLKAYLSR